MRNEEQSVEVGELEEVWHPFLLANQRNIKKATQKINFLLEPFVPALRFRCHTWQSYG
jgi:hypothetical protein